MKLTVVVPTLGEGSNLERALQSVPEEAEKLVSDGGSDDETLDIARRLGARIVTGPAGRARQMNRGAAAAGGDVLLFLHADCALEPDAAEAVERALEAADVVGGCFRLRIRNAGSSLKLIAFGSNLRARYLRTPYGDQGLFVRRSVFEEMGGFPDLAFMEDVALVRRLRRRGRLIQLECGIVTGPRHWERLGPLATTAVNWAMVSLFLLGVSPGRLLPWYRKLHRAPEKSAKPGDQLGYHPKILPASVSEQRERPKTR